MKRGHWLDPLARQILRVTGQVTLQVNKSNTKRSHDLNSIEKELQKLKRNNAVRPASNTFSIDVNRASASDWKKLPGCSSAMIELLLRLQKAGVQLSGEEDLFQLLELPEDLAREWHPHLIFQWYGAPPEDAKTKSLDLNSTSRTTLQKVLGWREERINSLIRERQRRPFANLADLQERMALSPSIIEKLIGNVCFSSKKAGPILPPKG